MPLETVPIQPGDWATLNQYIGNEIPLAAATGTDDTSAIQNALNQASGGTPIIVRGKPGQTYKLSASLVIYSNTILDMRGCTIQLNANSKCNMIHNAAWVAGSGRDTNIRISGGSWVTATNNDAPAGQARFLCLLQRVDGVKVSDSSWTRTDSTDVGRNVVCYACTGVEIARITHNTGGVGVNIMGASTGIHIHDIYGTTGDDFVVCNPIDISAYNNGDFGDIAGLNIHDIYPTSCQNGVKLLAGNNTGTPLSIRQAKIMNVYGATLSTGNLVWLGGDANDSKMLGGNHYDVRVDGVANIGTGATVHVFGSGTGTLYGLEFSHIAFNDQSTAKYTLGFDASLAALNVEDATVRNCFWTGTQNTSISPIVLASGAANTLAMGRLSLRDIDCNVTSLHVTVMQGTAACALTTFTVADSRLNNQNTTGSWIDNHNATAPTLSQAFYTNLEAARSNYIAGQFKTATIVSMSNIKATTANALIRTEAGCNISILQADSVTGTNAKTISNNGGTITGGHVIGSGYTTAPTYSASITPDCAQGSWQTITVTNGTAFTINAPTNVPASTQSGSLVVEVLNSSGGAMGAITWNAAFVFAGATWANPANTKKRFARFEWNGSAWVCTGVASADY